MAEPTRLQKLEALAVLLADRIEADKDGRLTAGLARQYRDTLGEIDELRRGSKKGSLVDELSKRRQARAPGKSRAAPARRGKDAGA